MFAEFISNTVHKKSLFHFSIKHIMDKHEMNNRTKRFGVSVIKLTKLFPNQEEFKIICSQIIRSSTSVGANYRASNRAKSNADIINKRKIEEEECDETLYWLEHSVELEPQLKEAITPIWRKGNEILSIIVASIMALRH
jgi:four helix bundle protein